MNRNITLDRNHRKVPLDHFYQFKASIMIHFMQKYLFFDTLPYIISITNLLCTFVFLIVHWFLIDLRHVNKYKTVMKTPYSRSFIPASRYDDKSQSWDNHFTRLMFTSILFLYIWSEILSSYCKFLSCFVSLI